MREQSSGVNDSVKILLHIMVLTMEGHRMNQQTKHSMKVCEFYLFTETEKNFSFHLVYDYLTKSKLRKTAFYSLINHLLLFRYSITSSSTTSSSESWYSSSWYVNCLKSKWKTSSSNTSYAIDEYQLSTTTTTTTTADT